MKSKYGLVLEGGGAKGAYHIGAYKALLELGYHFSGVAGTSIGALNGALICQGDWSKAWDLWYNSSNNAAYGFDDEYLSKLSKGQIDSDSAKYAAAIISDIVKSKGLDVDPMKKLFLEIFNEQKLRKSKMDLGIVTVKLPVFKSVELFKEQIPENDMFKYLIASANLPIFQTNNNIDGSYIDGGFRNNLPLNLLPQKGINKQIAIRTFAPGITKKIESDRSEVIYIEPSKPLGSMLDFSQNSVRKSLYLGYFDVYRKLGGYVGRQFCIKPLAEDFIYLKELLIKADERILKAAHVMGYKSVDPKRFMFERLFPQIADYLDIRLDTSYEILILTFFEEIATTLPLDRNKLYKADKFINEVQKGFFREHRNYNRFKTLPKIIQSNSFLSSFVKNDFFYFIMDIFLK